MSNVLPDQAEALVHANNLEKVLGLIANGESKPGAIPLESITKLIAFARYGRTQGATLNMSADDQLGPFTKHTCPVLAKAGDDEPIWTLVAKDITADDCVQRWIDKNVGRLGWEHPKILRACKTRDAMMEWPNRKLPD